MEMSSISIPPKDSDRESTKQNEGQKHTDDFTTQPQQKEFFIGKLCESVVVSSDPHSVSVPIYISGGEHQSLQKREFRRGRANGRVPIAVPKTQPGFGKPGFARANSRANSSFKPQAESAIVASLSAATRVPVMTVH